MMKIRTLICTIIAATLLSGCATIEGVGRDISGGANRVSDWMN